MSRPTTDQRIYDDRINLGAILTLSAVAVVVWSCISARYVGLIAAGFFVTAGALAFSVANDGASLALPADVQRVTLRRPVRVWATVLAIPAAVLAGLIFGAPEKQAFAAVLLDMPKSTGSEGLSAEQVNLALRYVQEEFLARFNQCAATRNAGRDRARWDKGIVLVFFSWPAGGAALIDVRPVRGDLTAAPSFQECLEAVRTALPPLAGVTSEMTIGITVGFKRVEQ